MNPSRFIAWRYVRKKLANLSQKVEKSGVPPKSLNQETRVKVESLYGFGIARSGAPCSDNLASGKFS
jgi:hypothetical protein